MTLREHIRQWIRSMQPVTYCGKTFGWKDRGIGFCIGAGIGCFAGSILFSSAPLILLTAVFGGFLAGDRFVRRKIEKRKAEFTRQFCDYLDTVSTCLSCGQNTYDSFLNADIEMQDLYREDAPICCESRKLTDGLKSGQRVGTLLKAMADRSECGDVATYGEIYSTCSEAGGNLKNVTDDSRKKLMDKLLVESEIRTFLSGPKNELNIMAVMPFVILAALRAMSGEFLPQDSVSVTTNLIALGIFVVSYTVGRKMIRVEF